MSLQQRAGMLALCTALAGCSNIGNFDVPKDPEGSPSVKTIIAEVSCELADIIRDPYYRSQMVDGDFVIAIQLNLTVNDDGSLAPSFTYTNGLFSFGAGGKLDIQREQNFTELLFYSVKDIIQTMKDDAKRGTDTFACPTQHDTWLAGDLGLKDSVRIALNSPFLATNTKLSGASGAFGGYVNFVVTANLNGVGPTWTLKHFKGPGGFAGVSQTNNDKLTFAFAMRSAAGGIPGLLPAPEKAKQANIAAQASAVTFINNIQTNQITTQLNAIRVGVSQ
jgi:hypothetical protein